MKIADSATYPNLGDAPALSENGGEVAFKGSTSTENFVLKGSGAALTVIASSAGSLDQFGNPSINASGDVVFWAQTDDSFVQVIAVGNGAAPTTLVTSSLIAPTGQFQVLDQSPDINAGGDVSFMGVKTQQGTGVFERTEANGTITTLAQESDGYSAFNITPIFTSLNNVGGVSFNAKLANGEKVIVEHSGPGAGGTRANLRDSSGPLNAFSRTAISQDGDVLSSVVLDNGAQNLIRYSDAGMGEVVQVDAAMTGFLQFESPNLIDNVGGMVFRGVLDSGVIGIYTGTAAGSDPVANKVIENGEMLGGKEISTILMSSNAANSHGQIAFFVTFTDSSSAIYRADLQVPVPTQTILTVPKFADEGTTVTLTATVTPTTPSNDVPTGSVEFVSVKETACIVVGADAGSDPTVKVLESTGKVSGSFNAYPTTFRGGVRVAMGDVTGDGMAEFITAPGPGGDNTIKIFGMSSSGSQVSFMDLFHITVSDPLIGTRGLQIATGDLNGDGFSDIIVSGGPKVFAYSGQDFSLLSQFTPFGTSATDVLVAVGDLTGDGLAEIVTSTGSGTNRWVKYFDPQNGNLLGAITPFEATFRGGVNIAVGDINGDGIAEIIAAKGPGSTPQVKVFGADGKLHSSFMAFDVSSREGVRVAAADLDGDGIQELIVDPAAVRGAAALRVFRTTGDKIEQDPWFVVNAAATGFLAASRTNLVTVVGTAPLDNNGIASFPTNQLGSGFNSLAARYLGSPAYHLSASAYEYILVRGLRDYGDAPFQSGLADDGARHRPASTGPILGTSRDAEYDGIYDHQDGDDSTGIDDEDGITFMSPVLNRSMEMALTSSVIVHASAAGFLDAFIDFNDNGRFEESERLTPASGSLSTQNNLSIPVVAGDNVISFKVPRFDSLLRTEVFGLIGGDDGISRTTGAYARFRISSTGGLSATGEAMDGEVEDYPIDIRFLGSNGGGGEGNAISIQLPAFAANNGGSNASASDYLLGNAGGIVTLTMSGNGQANPQTLFQIPASTRGQIRILGTAGDDTLRLDLSSDVSASDYLFDGGSQATAAGDSLVIIGGGRKFDHWNLNYTAPKDGTISIDGSTIEFKDLEPIVMNVVADHVTISTPDIRADASIQPDPFRAGFGIFTATAVLNGNGGIGGRFEDTYFLTPRLSLTVELSSYDDEFRAGSLPNGFERTSLIVRGNGGNDYLILQQSNVSATVDGGEGNDTIYGGASADLLIGGGGDDYLGGGNGNDELRGGPGSDFLVGGNGDDSLFGGDGKDSLFGESGNDVLTLNDYSGANTANETMSVNPSVGEQAFGGDGNDVINGDSEPRSSLLNGVATILIEDLSGDAGDDTIFGSSNGASSLHGGDGNDVLFGRTTVLRANTLFGGLGDDRLTTSGEAYGEDGNDTLEGSGTLSGGNGADRITGSSTADSIDGGSGNDTIDAGAGKDSVAGGAGRDAIDGGAGDDTLTGGSDEDTINGGAGNDLITGDQDNDSLNGGDGNDTVGGGDDDDTVLGGTGNDSVSGDDGDDRVLGQAGDDTVSAGEGLDYLDGGTGSDAIFEVTLNATITPTRLTLVNLDGDTEVETLRGIERASLSAAFSPAGVSLNASAFRGSVTLFGSAFNDTITGGNGTDSIDGGFGNDSILGGTGNDTLLGGGDADTIKASDGNDSISGGDGDDMLFGERGRDTISGGNGNDSIEGDVATDSVAGTFGNDSLLGDAGNDTIRGGFGDDVLKGGADNDQLFGDRGNDLLNGGSGNDVLEGDKSTDTAVGVAGNDSLTGQDGDDTLRGFAGNDVLVGGNGKDSLDGGAGKDTLLGEGDNDTLTGGADKDVLTGGAGLNNVFTAPEAGEINEAFTFPGGRPAWIDEI